MSKTKQETNYHLAIKGSGKSCGNCSMLHMLECLNPDGSTHTEGLILPFMVCDDWVKRNATPTTT